MSFGGIKVADGIKDDNQLTLKQEDYPGLFTKFQGNHNSPCKWKREAENQVRIRERFENARVLALKMEKGRKMDIPPRPLEGTYPCWHLDFRPV